MRPLPPPSLRTHLTVGLTVDGHHDRLPYRDDCPFCRHERSAAPEAAARPSAPRRTRAALAAGVLALGSLGSGGAAIATPTQVHEEGSAEPEAPLRPGEEEPDFDPGAEDRLEPETQAPPPISGGDEDDDSGGAPLETEPDERLGATEEAAPPSVPAPPPTETVPSPVAPAPPPVPLAPQAPANPAPPATQPQPPLREPAARERLPLLVAPIPNRPPRPPAPGGLPQFAGGQQPAPPPTGSSPSGPAPVAPLSPEVPDAGGPAAPPADQGEQLSDGPRDADIHRVRPGESLWSIADRLAGPNASPPEVARLVERLWELNAERIGTGDPDLVMPGTELVLPQR